jgi:anti-anti-sigma factor
MKRRKASYEVQGNVLVVYGDPEYNDPNFRAACEKLLTCDRPGQILVIDLSDVTFVSSREIGVLVATAKKARQKNCSLLIRVSRAVHTMLRILRLDKFITFEVAEPASSSTSTSDSVGDGAGANGSCLSASPTAGS